VTANFWLTLVTALIGGAFSGVFATLLTLSQDNKRERQRQKLDVLHELVANRNDLQGQAFTRALNAISTAYFDAPDVLSALTAFHESVTRRDGNNIVNDKLVVLWRAMCTAAGIDQSRLTDSFFLQPFNIRP
jgi:hypothetical protein